jgi:hypothetical protein
MGFRLMNAHPPTNTSRALEAILRRVARGDVQAVVVASLTGATAVRVARALAGRPQRLICVADTPEWTAYGHPYPTLDAGHHRELLQRGVAILRDYRSSSAGAPRFDPTTGTDVPLSAPEAGLFWAGVSVVGGEGLKTAVKCVVLATDYGLLRPGERVASLGGSGEQEAAVVMDALGHAEILSGAPGTRLRVREVLHMPD